MIFFFRVGRCSMNSGVTVHVNNDPLINSPGTVHVNSAKWINPLDSVQIMMIAKKILKTPTWAKGRKQTTN
jgi:hypothetical protein